MAEITGTIAGTSPKRGRGPGGIKVTDADGVLWELTTFDPALIRDAAEGPGRTGKFSYEEKPNPKDEAKPYRNLTLMALDAPVASQEAPGSTIVEGEATQVLAPVSLPVGPPLRRLEPQSAMTRLEEGFALAVRQRELLEHFIRSRFKEGEHYFDGSMFGSKKRVLAQPGAQLILFAHGYVVDFEPSGVMTAPESVKTSYTIVVKATIRNGSGIVVGSGLGSCTSLIYSSRAGGYTGRAVDPDKTHNSTLKMAKKRALVDGCLNATAASEFFTQDIDEGGYGDAPTPKAPGRFFKRG